MKRTLTFAIAFGLSAAAMGQAWSTSRYVFWYPPRRRVRWTSSKKQGGAKLSYGSWAAGETQALFTVAPALLPLIQGHRVKLIAATSAQRRWSSGSTPT